MTIKIAQLKEEDGIMTFTISNIDISYIIRAHIFVVGHFHAESVL